MSVEPANSNEHLLLSIANGTEVDAGELPGLDTEQIVEHILADPDVTQFVMRTQSDGSDSLIGYFRCDFEETQERYILHVPLVPPMDKVPVVETKVIDDDASARIRITDRQKFGIRLEIIRSTEIDQASKLTVEVAATSAHANELK